MRRDRIDELASELFAAAREERPERGLAERVERAAALEGNANAVVDHRVQQGVIQGVRRNEERAEVPGQRDLNGREPGHREPRRRLMPVLLAAVVLAGGVAVLLLLPRSTEGVLMSAESVPSAAPMGSSRVLPGSAGAPHGQAAGSDASAADDGVTEPARATAHGRDVEARGDGAREGVADRGAARASDRGAGSRETPAPPRKPSSSKGTAPAPPGPPTVTTPPPASAPTLATELGLIRQIRQALRSNDAAAALALLDRYDTGEYGKRLSLEASVLRVEALDAVGRRAEAEALARRFVRENADSPLAERAQSFIPSPDPERPSEGASP